MKNNNNTSVQIRLDVPYGGGPQENLCVDIYLPAGAGMHPALLCLHGGAWQHGSQRQYQSWGPWLAERGYAVVAVDYRLSSQVSPAWPGAGHSWFTFADDHPARRRVDEEPNTTVAPALIRFLGEMGSS